MAQGLSRACAEVVGMRLIWVVHISQGVPAGHLKGSLFVEAEPPPTGRPHMSCTNGYYLWLHFDRRSFVLSKPHLLLTQPNARTIVSLLHQLISLQNGVGKPLHTRVVAVRCVVMEHDSRESVVGCPPVLSLLR